jgi:hypothetical protein
MIEEMAAAPLGRVIGMVVTPMNADEEYSVNEEALRRQIDWCFAQAEPVQRRLNTLFPRGREAAA